MVQLVGLPGVSREKTEAAFVRSVTAASKELRAGNAITSAGDCGAVNVWKDDEGMWRCEFHRFMVTIDSKTFKYLAAVCEWLREWMPRMNDAPAPNRRSQS
jgi:hypothetical protein